MSIPDSLKQIWLEALWFPRHDVFLGQSRVRTDAEVLELNAVVAPCLHDLLEDLRGEIEWLDEKNKHIWEVNIAHMVGTNLSFQ